MSSPAAADRAPPRSGYHEYVLGRHAWSNEELGSAARFFAEALSYNRDDATLLRRTFDLSLAAADYKLARSLAADLKEVEDNYLTLILWDVADAYRREDYSAAASASQSLAQTGIGSLVSPIVSAWASVEAGELDLALKALDPALFEGAIQSYVIEHRGYILSLARGDEAALAELQGVLAADGVPSATSYIQTAALAQKLNGTDAALAILENASQLRSQDPRMTSAIDVLRHGDTLDLPVGSPDRGVAELFLRVSLDLMRERPVPLALTFARLSTYVDPDFAEGWLAASQILSRLGQEKAALASLQNISGANSLEPLAQLQRARLLEELSGDPEEALDILNRIVADTPGSLTAWTELGDTYRESERFKEAAEAYDRALGIAGAEAPLYWYLTYLRGVTAERMGDWDLAERYLREALRLRPDDPNVLNYLGYSLLDRRIKLDEARLLIEKAVEAQPGDGYIVDSLGWAHYVAGNYEDAVRYLEQAIAEVPGDPTINEHLGDAYWRVGRTIEARFRWKAALDSDPEADAIGGLRAKIDYGLDVALADLGAGADR